MTINLQLPQKQTLKPTITVFGVGGGGGNAVSNMIEAELEGVNFVVANTDAQALEENKCKEHIQLGDAITQGLGAGSFPEVGKASAEDSAGDILEHLQGSNMVFITAGLGGGTGTGAAPVVARIAREQGILTVAVVTKPFHFEGSHRMRVAELGLQELAQYVDTLIVIPNQNLFRVADKNTTFLDAFKLADEVLHCGVRGITDLMTMPGLINLDFSDVRSVMSEMGKAMMGTGQGSGENRALDAAEAAIANPLLDNVSMQGARGVLVNITGGEDMTLFEVDEAANRIREEVDPDANIIFGSAFNTGLEGSIRVSVVATGIDYGADEKKVTHIYTEQEGQKPAASPSAKVRNVTADLASEQDTKPTAYSAILDDIVKNTHSVKSDISVETGSSAAAAATPEPEQPSLDLNDGFVPPAPAEPKNIDISDEPLKVPEGLFEPVTKAQSSSIFGNLFGGRKKPSVTEEITIETKKNIAGQQIAPEGSLSQKFSTMAQQQTTSGDIDVLEAEEDLDIPAFLRRKK